MDDLSSILGGDFSARWRLEKERWSQFLNGIGFTGDEHSQSLYIFPQPAPDPYRYLDGLRAQVDVKGQWSFIVGRFENKDPTVIAFPVNQQLTAGEAQAALF